MMLRISVNTVLRGDYCFITTLEVYSDYTYCFTLEFDENKKILKSCSELMQEYTYTRLDADLIDRVINSELHIPKEVNIESVYLCVPIKMFKNFESYITNYFRICFTYLEKLNAERTDIPKEIVEMQQLKNFYNLKNYLGDL